MAKRARKPERKRAMPRRIKPEAFMTQLGNRIKELRKKSGFSSAELFAYDIEISRVGMSKYETGAFNDIKMGTLLKIIDGLGMKPKDFFAEGFD